MIETRTPVNKCLYCKHEVDGLSSVFGDDTPKDGDITVCFHCGGVMAIDRDLTVRLLKREEILGIFENPRLVTEIGLLVATIYQARHNRN